MLAPLQGTAFHSFGITECLLVTKATRGPTIIRIRIKDLLLQENADVFCCQIGLIQDDLPSSNLEFAIGAAQ